MSPESALKETPEKKDLIKRVPWHPVVGVLFVVAMFFLSQIIGGLLLSGYFLLQNQSQTEITANLSGSVTAQFFFVLLTEIIILTSLYFFMKQYKFGFTDIGLIKPRWRDVGIGLTTALPYYLVFFATVAAATLVFPGLDTNQKQEIGFDNVQGEVALAMTFLILVVLQPITEEIVVRGFLYSSLKKALPVILAAVGTSLIFAAAHLPASSSGPLYIAGIDTFLLSFFLIYLRERTGSLWSSITLHSVKNGVAFLALFIFKVV